MNKLLESQAGPGQEWLAIKDAAVVTGLSVPHIRRAVRSGDLSAANVGTRARPVWRIARADLDHWMRRRVGEGAPSAGAAPSKNHSRHFDD
jgi:excisionase family DNA binding protein